MVITLIVLLVVLLLIFSKWFRRGVIGTICLLGSLPVLFTIDQNDPNLFQVIASIVLWTLGFYFFYKNQEEEIDEYYKK